ncbi:outer membrane beta-barrel protein [Salinimicrobium sp. GXAS 041]|uniref:outer membrane beta-barrel protein n=1 Tax=Salinimicrobium sp. GXAS 041 TaxID=3400806 RepID=UPI003C77A176
MKKGLFIFMLIAGTSAFAQSGFGVKGGLNYSDNGKIEYSDLTETGENILEEKADRKTGYHFGIFYRANLGPVFLKPELVYTTAKSSYEYKNESEDFDVTTLNLPVMVGVQILGPLNVFAGPSFQYYLDNDFAGLSLEDMENEFTVGAQFGVGVQLGSLGVDVRYEQALSENQAEVARMIGGEEYVRLDSRPNQFIVSLSLNL